ncbi:MAG: hypothetical protein Q9220_003709 [cf. Caloplaca sp. 1 TL-2023]
MQCAHTSILRQIVAGPRQKHSEAGLDLCYVTDNIIATSGPSSTFPQKAYRNPTDALVKYLDYKHGKDWAIWEFRAEGTGYPDSEVYGRIRHYPWPDHHPPPFAIIPNVMASMRDWLKGPDTKVGRVVVVHCKAGKGRSGTAACSYLISEEGWTVEDALLRFTARRMRSGFGAGVSIPSQLRWIRYVDTWTKHQKVYVERQIEVVEVHAWGLRDGVKVAVEGYINEGRTIKNFHTFHRDERIIVESNDPSAPITSPTSTVSENSLPLSDSKARASNSQSRSNTGLEAGGHAVIFRPTHPIILPTNDINIDLERRNKAAYGWTMVTSVAHVWFNTYFESLNPEIGGTAAPNGVFEITWDAMDGIKGSARKGTKALDRLAVIWRAVVVTASDTHKTKDDQHLPTIITEPKVGEPVPESEPADWRSAQHSNLTSLGKDLGLRTESPVSAGVSKASSLRSSSGSSPSQGGGEEDHLVGVKTHGLEGEERVHARVEGMPSGTMSEPDLGLPKVASPESAGGKEKIGDIGLGSVASVVKEMKTTSIEEGKEGESAESKQHVPGQLIKDDGG